jgi:hypothetical protein
MRIRLCKAPSLDYNREDSKGDGMIKEDYVGRRNFLKTTTPASMTATLRAANLLSQDAANASKARPQGNNRKRLLLSAAQKMMKNLQNR